MAAAARVAGCAVSPALITGVTRTGRLPGSSPDRGIRATTGTGLAPGYLIGGRRGRRRPANGVAGGRAARSGRTALADQPSHPRQRRGSAINTAATEGRAYSEDMRETGSSNGVTVMRAESAIGGEEPPFSPSRAVICTAWCLTCDIRCSYFSSRPSPRSSGIWRAWGLLGTDTTGMSRSGQEGRLLLGHVVSGVMGSGAAGRSDRGQHGCGSRSEGQAAPEAVAPAAAGWRLSFPAWLDG